MKKPKIVSIAIILLALCAISYGVESTFRLLSVSESEKLILVSQIPGKTKYLLDASSAKITVNGKPAEYKSLKAYSILQVKMETRKTNKNGIDLDGIAIEIKISTEEKPKQ
jgi:hypothetical protein